MSVAALAADLDFHEEMERQAIARRSAEEVGDYLALVESALEVGEPEVPCDPRVHLVRRRSTSRRKARVKNVEKTTNPGRTKPKPRFKKERKKLEPIATKKILVPVRGRQKVKRKRLGPITRHKVLLSALRREDELEVKDAMCGDPVAWACKLLKPKPASLHPDSELDQALRHRGVLELEACARARVMTLMDALEVSEIAPVPDGLPPLTHAELVLQ